MFNCTLKLTVHPLIYNFYLSYPELSRFSGHLIRPYVIDLHFGMCVAGCGGGGQVNHQVGLAQCLSVPLDSGAHGVVQGIPVTSLHVRVVTLK